MSFQFMPLFTGDYLRDTQHLSCSEHGIYLKLLMFCWDQKGPAPIDERKLAGIVNARSGDEIEAMRRVVGEFFIRMDDGYYNKRMAAEIERSAAISEQRGNAGRRGATARIARLRDSQAIAKQLPSNCQANAEQLLSKCQASASTPTPTPTPTPTTTPTPTPTTTPDQSHAETQALILASTTAEKDQKIPTTSHVSTKKKAVGTQNAASAAAWAAYSDAYAARYGVQPLRNATTNSQMAAFVRRAGRDEAPALAAWFISHPGVRYVQGGHTVGLLLQDAEKLRTEWVTGRVSGVRKGRQAEIEARNEEAVARLIASVAESGGAIA